MCVYVYVCKYKVMCKSRDSSVRKVTDYRLDHWTSVPGRGGYRRLPRGGRQVFMLRCLSTGTTLPFRCVCSGPVGLEFIHITHSSYIPVA